jgi:hypothetical protein
MVHQMCIATPTIGAQDNLPLERKQCLRLVQDLFGRRSPPRAWWWRWARGPVALGAGAGEDVMRY